MISEKNKIIALSFLLVSVFVISFINLNRSAKIEQDILHITSNIQKLKLSNILVSEEINNNLQRQNYDNLNRLIKQSLQKWRLLSSEIKTKFSNHSKILSQIEQIGEAISKEKQLLLHYESDKAILANSAFFLIRLEANIKYNSNDILLNYLKQLNRLLRDIAYYNIGLDEVQENINELIRFTQEEDMSPYIDVPIVNKHLEIFSAKSTSIKHTIDTIKSIDIPTQLDTLERLFLEVVDTQRLTRKSISVLIAVFYFLMLIGFLIIFFKTYNDKEKILELQKTNEEKNHEIMQHIQLLKEYKRALDESSIVSKTDLNGTITFVNENFCKLSGYKEKELLGKSHNIIRHPDMSKKVFYELWKTIQAKKVFHGMIKNKKKNGDFYYVDTTVLPILDVNANITEYFAVRHDVTDLVLSREKALAAEKAKSAFLSTMSHELRTPLNSVIGFSQIILARDDMPAETLRSFIDKINISGKHLLNLVNNILDFSKIESGKMQLNKQSFLLDKIVNEAILLVESELNKKEIKMQLIGFKSIEVFADEQLLKQVIINILSNAVKFSPQNSNITISYKQIDSSHLFCICDEGIGLSDEDKKTIFKPFSQVKEHQNKAIKGTGLGLVISQKIVELHQGKIKVVSELNKGSCFNIFIPIAKGCNAQ